MKRQNIPKNKSGIYQIQSVLKGWIYIGSAINLKRRVFSEHIRTLKKGNHDNPKLQNHVNKYGITDLKFFIIEFCKKKNLIQQEQFYLDELNPEFNIAPIAGSQLGFRHSEETREKMSRYHSNRPAEINKQQGQAISGKNNPMYGKHPIPWNKGKTDLPPQSEETRAKRSKSMTGKKMPPFTKEHRGNLSKAMKKRMLIKENNGMYGRKHSEESKKKMSKNRKGKGTGKGKSPSEETKKKISESLKKWYAKQNPKPNPKNNEPNT